MFTCLPGHHHRSFSPSHPHLPLVELRRASSMASFLAFLELICEVTKHLLPHEQAILKWLLP